MVLDEGFQLEVPLPKALRNEKRKDLSAPSGADSTMSVTGGVLQITGEFYEFEFSHSAR